MGEGIPVFIDAGVFVFGDEEAKDIVVEVMGDGAEAKAVGEGGLELAEEDLAAHGGGGQSSAVGGGGRGGGEELLELGEYQVFGQVQDSACRDWLIFSKESTMVAT